MADESMLKFLVAAYVTKPRLPPRDGYEALRFTRKACLEFRHWSMTQQVMTGWLRKRERKSVLASKLDP